MGLKHLDLSHCRCGRASGVGGPSAMSAPQFQGLVLHVDKCDPLLLYVCGWEDDMGRGVTGFVREECPAWVEEGGGYIVVLLCSGVLK